MEDFFGMLVSIGITYHDCLAEYPQKTKRNQP